MRVRGLDLIDQPAGEVDRLSVQTSKSPVIETGLFDVGVQEITAILFCTNAH